MRATKDVILRAPWRRAGSLPIAHRWTKDAGFCWPVCGTVYGGLVYPHNLTPPGKARRCAKCLRASKGRKP